MSEKRQKILAGPFRGATTYLDWRRSKRKVFGVYEHVLNNWMTEKIGKHDTFFDVGANNGYHTYGFAWAAKKAGHRRPVVVAVEPTVKEQLREPMTWNEYTGCDIQLVEKLCGTVTDDATISLPDLLAGHDAGLVKIDIEGAEELLFDECPELAENVNFDWCIEIHGDDLIPKLAGVFCDAGRSFLLQELRPLPFIGLEARAIHTTWLTTI
ncbi:MAG: FkbM family methyltransferase [Maritimibacter sp.]|uniref:hypothetical protein n=1 Tax=Maritimibacter sp. TaxID=2003363 RepID=UPI001D4C97A9|nr:hypothetical protein [Maritimibacter sp.]MBL6427647.1 FkbM family methyltransferase [Maritimibacter sp.]